jgi:N-carbamoylputrescine amidase
MDKLTEVRDLWQFYRDRRPDSYESLVNPLWPCSLRAARW